MGIDCEAMGETAFLLRLGDGMDAAVNARVHALAAAIREHAPHAPGGLVDVVPAYASVLVRHRSLEQDARGQLQRWLLERVEEISPDPSAHPGPCHEIPVCYGGEYGPDLDALARLHELEPDQVVKLHSAVEYRVAMTGFAPGFPYLLGLDKRLATPRRETPRIRVPGGSVGIAGAQTGVYPGELPGGWQLIGRTPLALFRADDVDRPCLVQPGDRVRFRAIDPSRFRTLQEVSC